MGDLSVYPECCPQECVFPSPCVQGPTSWVRRETQELCHSMQVYFQLSCHFPSPLYQKRLFHSRAIEVAHNRGQPHHRTWLLYCSCQLLAFKWDDRQPGQPVWQCLFYQPLSIYFFEHQLSSVRTWLNVKRYKDAFLILILYIYIFNLSWESASHYFLWYPEIKYANNIV